MEASKPRAPLLAATTLIVVLVAVGVAVSQTDKVLRIHAALTSEAALEYEAGVHQALESLGIARNLPTLVQMCLLALGALVGLLCAAIVYCWTSRPRARQIRLELRDARQRVQALQDELEQHEKLELKMVHQTKPIRIFMEGAFDLMHFGHMNAFRLGRGLGDYLLVGINSSESIAECKGFAPIMTDEERYTAVSNCAFVDEVIRDTPYVMTPEYLAWVIETYKIDYVVHGDDPCLVNGEDVYGLVKKQGKFKSIPRTEGVSTTDIVGRMLICTRSHHLRPDPPEERGKGRRSRSASPTLLSVQHQTGVEEEQSYERSSQFLTTSSILRAFSRHVRPPKPTDTIVYIDGSWDLFHAGHSKVLQEARKLGDYLIVGIFNDDVVNGYRHANFPIMNLNERVLSVLGCKYISDVLIDAPWIVTHELMESLKVDVVVSGTVSDVDINKDLRFAVPMSRGKYREVESPREITVNDILGRINDNRGRYELKFASKKKKEDEYYAQRYHREATP